MAAQGHKYSSSLTTNQKAQLANAYNELGKELSSQKIKVVGNYTMGKLIGEGSFGTVRMGTHRITGTRVAIKQIPKAMSAQLTREIHHHRRLHHPHVAQLYEVIATENHIWLVTELCSGGELYDYLVEKGRLTEEETRIIFGQLCLAVGYIHDKGVVHRDLKLENVLLDERCRVKLSDFGFTREYERGNFLETWCGTTGYAAPEMLLCQKYLGQEVDIWSLGVILYTLLTGTLPFDDDNEMIQKENIIKGEYEDAEWLSDGIVRPLIMTNFIVLYPFAEARDLLRKVLQREPSKRLNIRQILTHSWFTRPTFRRSKEEDKPLVSSPPGEPAASSSNASDVTSGTFHSAVSEISQSAPTTPDETVEEKEVEEAARHSNISQSTIKKLEAELPRLNTTTNIPPRLSSSSKQSPEASPRLTPVEGSGSHSPSSNKAPLYPSRTPARTKRRSVSSTLSVPSPTTAGFSQPQPPQDFISTLTTPAPIVFSTPLERDLLNSLSALGFDTGQMVHSVLTDACDSSGALWWMLRRRAERRAMDEAAKKGEVRAKDGLLLSAPGTRGSMNLSESSDSAVEKVTEALKESGVDFQSPTPDLGIVPPTPTLPQGDRPKTPSPVTSPTLLVPQPLSPVHDSNQRSTTTSPSSSKGRGTKPRSSSVSIMQRATTALEAAGLVRKKSDEKFRKEEAEKEREREREKEKEKEESTIRSHKSREKEKEKEREKEEKRPHTSGDEPRGSNKLLKSPPMKPHKDSSSTASIPLVEPLSGLPSVPSSPWIMAPSTSVITAPTPSNSPGVPHVALPQQQSGSVGSASGGKQRTRASILHAFRMWFHEDRKGKRKGANNQPPLSLNNQHLSPIAQTPSTSSVRGGRSKRHSGNSSITARRGGHKKRPSASSRRSSSVNSRRSSVASNHKLSLEFQPVPEDPFNPRRRSFGTRTPTSERGDHPSRPSSIRSFKVSTPGLPPMRRSNSPSGSSTGSGRRSLRRTDSPLQRYHRRAGSASSTRVIRQVVTVHPHPPNPHVRSNSIASSLHSAPSSRPGSFHEGSEAENNGRTGSPFRPASRQDSDEATPRRASFNHTVLVAHKKQTPFHQPSLGRTSWKKAWGVEPPGWKSRSTEAPLFEVLFTDDPKKNVVRDVFSGRPSLSLDDDDWVDEDDDFIPFAGGLGQSGALAAFLSNNSNNNSNSNGNNAASSGGMAMETYHNPEPLVLGPAPRGMGRPQGKRNVNNSRNVSNRQQKPGQSPVATPTPLPGPEENRSSSSGGSSRRQLPGRAEPAFRQPIQEEDEGEEEE